MNNMNKFTILKSEAVLLPYNNIDTDQIIPARFLKTTSRDSFAEKVFYDRRFNSDGSPKRDFALNCQKGGILVAGENFGCGSSREHAAWALYDYGFRAVIAPSFADIFKNNALNNALLPIVVESDFYNRIVDILSTAPNTKIEINLIDCTVEVCGVKRKFEINPYKRECLINSYSDVDYIIANNKPQQKTIAVLPGDGIGPEVIEQAVKVAEAVNSKFPQKVNFKYGIIGAAAIDKCNDPYPDETHQLCTKCDAILFGALGDPKYSPNAKIRPEQGLLKMRKQLGLFANIRPLKPFNALLNASPLKREVIASTDMVVVRELTGGLYFGTPRGRSESNDYAFDTCSYSREEISRIARIGFNLAMQRRNKLTLVDKANVLATSRLWRETVTEIQNREYPNVSLDFMYVDNAAMRLVMEPAYFDVLLTENLFGDILSDLCGAIGGSIGLMPSASLGADNKLFEPIHGSFPQAKGLNIANPIATILSLAMLYENAFGALREAAAIRSACRAAVENGVGTPDLFPKTAIGTKEVGDYISNIVRLL